MDEYATERSMTLEQPKVARYDGPQDVDLSPLPESLARLEAGIDRIANAVERSHKQLSPITRENENVPVSLSQIAELTASPITQQIRHQADRANDLADQLMTLLGRIDI
jgi:hypothetical protein